MRVLEVGYEIAYEISHVETFYCHYEHSHLEHSLCHSKVSGLSDHAIEDEIDGLLGYVRWLVGSIYGR